MNNEVENKIMRWVMITALTISLIFARIYSFLPGKREKKEF